jgi:hypothetical protein
MKEAADMARRPDTPSGAEPVLQFLQARRAFNLSSMRLLEESLKANAAWQRSGGAAWQPLARVSAAQAGVVRDAASVYRAATAHLSP